MDKKDSNLEIPTTSLRRLDSAVIKTPEEFEALRLSTRIPSFCVDIIFRKTLHNSIKCAVCDSDIPLNSNAIRRRREFVGEPKIVYRNSVLCYECWTKC